MGGEEVIADPMGTLREALSAAGVPPCVVLGFGCDRT